MPIAGGVFQPEELQLPTVAAQPVEIGQPPSLQQQAQANAPQGPQSPQRVSGFTGKGGQSLNFVDKFLQGWMGGKNIAEQKAIQQRSNDIKVHSITAQTMYGAAQSAADEARRLEESGAPADKVTAAHQHAKETYESYSNEQRQYAEAFAKHMGVNGEPQKGVKGKVKGAVQQAFLPQVASMLAPEAVKALAQPRPLKVPTEEERLGLDEKKSAIAANKAKTDEALAGAAQWRAQTDETKRKTAGEARWTELAKKPHGQLTPEEQTEQAVLDMQHGIMPLDNLKNSVATKIQNKTALSEDEHQVAVGMHLLPDTTPSAQPGADGFLHWVTPPSQSHPQGTDIKTKFRVTDPSQKDAVEREYGHLSQAWKDTHNGATPDPATRGALRMQAVEGTERTWQRYDQQKRQWEDEVIKQQRIIDDQQKNLPLRARPEKPMTSEQIRQKAEQMAGPRPQTPGSAATSDRVNSIFNDIFPQGPQPGRVH